MDAPSLAAEARIVTNADRLAHRAALESLIEQRFRRFPRAQVVAWLDAADVPTGAVNDVPSVVDHPQLAARHRWTTVDAPGGAIPALVPPHNLRGAPASMQPVPALGAHTAEVMAELGLVPIPGDAP